jgi:hypothetical protein
LYARSFCIMFPTDLTKFLLLSYFYYMQP